MKPSKAMARATIVDVAHDAGVSRQTVSNVLNKPHKVAPATREKVQAAIEELDFRPSRAASVLRQEFAGAWGFELDTMGSGRLGTVLDRFLVDLTESAGARRRHVLPFVAAPERSVAVYQDLLRGRQVDGFVLANTMVQDDRPGWLLSEGVPFASFGRIWGRPDITNFADVDGAAGVRLAVEHLRSQGYGTVGFLGWPEGSPVGDDRRSGWASLCDGAPEESAVQDFDDATRAAGRLVEQIGTGSAIVCASDVLAAGVWRYLTQVGLVPGRDVGVVGFDDTDTAAALGLASLTQPLDRVAAHVLDLLMGEPVGPGLFEPTLTVRASATPKPLRADSPVLQVF